MKKTLAALILTLTTPACMTSMSDSASCRTAGLSASQMECQNLSGGSPCSMVTAPSPGGTKTILCWAQGQSQNNSFATTGGGSTSSTGVTGTQTSGSSSTTTGTAPSLITGSGVMSLIIPTYSGMDVLTYNGKGYYVDLNSAQTALQALDTLRKKSATIYSNPYPPYTPYKQFNIQFTGTESQKLCPNSGSKCWYMNFQSVSEKK